MEIAILFALGLVALIVITFIMMLVTRSELGRLRREVAALRARLQAGAGAAPPVAAGAEPAAPVAPPAPAPPPRRRPPEPRPRITADLEKVIGGQWLTWLGIIAIFLGTAFFLAIKLENSPLAGLPQVLIAAVVAAGFLLIGRFVARTLHRFLGLGLLGGGIALLYLVAYGLFGFHRLVAAEVVFPALLAVAFLGALVALAQDSRTIAGLTLIGALLTPMVLTAEQGAAYTLLPYLIGVDLGAVLVARRRGWAGLALGSFLGTAALVAAWWEPHFAPAWRSLVLVTTTVIWLLYGVGPWLGRMRPGFWGLARTALVAANGAWYAAVVYAALGPDLDEARGAALFVIAAVYVAASILGGRGRRDDPALIANFYTGAALAILAMPVQFDGFTVSLAWALVGVLLLVMGWRLNDPHHRLAAMAGLLFAAVRVVVTGLDDLGHLPDDYHPLLNLPFVADAAVVAALLAAAWIQRRSGEATLAWERWARRAVEPVAAVTAWWVLTAETARWMEAKDDGQLPVVTVALVWVLYAAAAQALGLHRGRPWLRIAALVSLACAGLAAFIIQAVYAVSAKSDWTVLWNAGFVAGAAGVALLAWIARIGRSGDPRLKVWERSAGTPLLVVTLAAALLTITLELLAWFHARHGGDVFADAAALLTISLFWTLYGGGLVWAGFASRVRAVRLAGMALLGLVIVKVFAVDIRALSEGYRIVSFVGVGVLLLVISLLYQRERKLGAQG